MRHWLLLLFLTIGMSGIYYPKTMTVTAVERGIVTMQTGEGTEYIIEAAEAWRVGDQAECLMWSRGTEYTDDDRIIQARYIWKERK